MLSGQANHGNTNQAPKSLTCNGTIYNATQFWGFYVIDDTGAKHALPTTDYLITGDPCDNNTGFTDTTVDGSGYTMVAKVISETANICVYNRSGFLVDSCGAIAAVKDPDGFSISKGSTLVDTLGVGALTTNYPTAAPGSPLTFQYTDSSSNPQIFEEDFQSYTQQTAFNCAGINDIAPTSILLVGTLKTPVGNFSFSYEPTPGNPSNTTGRLAGITYPNGGSVTFSYSGGNNGVYCNTTNGAVVPTLTKTVRDGQGNVYLWTYVNSNSSSATNFTVTETGPANNTGQPNSGANQIVHQFVGRYETQTLYYQGPATGTPLKTLVRCYNASFTSCAGRTSLITTAITQTDVYTSLNGSPYSVRETKYDNYGNVTYHGNWDYSQTLGAAPSGTPLQSTTTTYASVGSYIYDKPATVVVTSAGTTSASTTYSNYSATGHVGTVSNLVSGTSSLSKGYIYNTNGTLATFTDVNGSSYQFGYSGTGGCNGVFPTSTTATGSGLPSNGLASSNQWDCNGGVVTQTNDVNQQLTTYTYTDPLWRISSTKDPTGATTTYSYPTAATLETVLSVSSGSAEDKLTTADGLARPVFVQKRQSPSSANFDSVQYTYGWSVTGAVVTTSLPYVGTQGQPAPAGTAVTVTQYDTLGRVLSTVDGGGGVTSYSYSGNDVVVQVSGGGQAFNKQLEYDGLWRLTSVCEMSQTLSGVKTCCRARNSRGIGRAINITLLDV